MGEDEVLRQSRQYYIDKISEKAPEIRSWIKRIMTFDQDLNEVTDILAIIMGDDASTTAPAGAGTAPATGVRPKLREDEFTGKPYFHSVKNYLERIGHAVSMEELLDALKRGGSPVGGKTPKKTLYISLVRSIEFAPVPGHKDFVGLRKWYPGLRVTEKKAPEKKRKK
jgi:hypothetical protein